MPKRKRINPIRTEVIEEIAKPDKTVFVWVGDGGFTMTGHECAAIVQEGLPVKVIVCDNSAWGSILTHQQKRFGADFQYGTLLDSPDFAKLAEGYGMASFKVEKTEEFPDARSERREVRTLGCAQQQLLP